MTDAGLEPLVRLPLSQRRGLGLFGLSSRVRAGLFTAAVIVVGYPAIEATAAEPITARVEFYGLAGLHVLTLHSQLDEIGDRYAIGIDYATRGVAGLVQDITVRSSVRGRLGTATAQPETFRSDGKRSGTERHNWVDYHPDGTVDGGSTPKPDDPLPAGTGRGTVDNLTAYFLLERQLALTGKCAFSVPVFDGRHRYDLYFTDAGQQNLSPDGGQQFQGSAIACHMRRQVRGIPGPEQNEGARAGTIWYAKLLPGDVMVPVRMQLETQIGSVDGYLAEIRGRGVAKKFME